MTASLSAFSLSVMALATAAVIVVAPRSASTLKGRTSTLAWTRRLRTVAAVLAVLDVALFLLAAATPTSAAAGRRCSASCSRSIVDLALARHRSRSSGWPPAAACGAAEQQLRAAAPVTVAITGSYGKTTTKLYVRHLVAGAAHACWPARPASTTPAACPAR